MKKESREKGRMKEGKKEERKIGGKIDTIVNLTVFTFTVRVILIAACSPSDLVFS